ncbi:Ig-like domain-containing protein, partial [Pseudozobellia thermophila]|uniref:Ig-like domain-containing protein n=1 Tax=Pseudozobellia thermophila TaxID=192903 RepID=UPI00147EAB2A
VELTVDVEPANADDPGVTWTSSDTSIATVSDTGGVSAVSPGTATITATTVDGGFTDTSEITVNAVSVPVTGIVVEPPTVNLTVGETVELTADVEPVNADDPSVTWTSSDTSIATVSDTGEVSAVSPGTATITATTVDGGFTDTSEITVTEEEVNLPPTAEDISLVIPIYAGNISIDVADKISDPENDDLTVGIQAPPANGTATISGTEIKYTANNGFTGNDVIIYSVDDGNSEVTATITIHVNSPPVANDDYEQVIGTTPIFIDVIENDSDLDEDILSISYIDQPSPISGVSYAEIVGNGISFQAAPGFTGRITFSYTITDGSEYDTALVTIDVN